MDRRHTLTFLFLAFTAASAQTFEVASIKPNASGDNRVMIGIQPGGRFTATGVTLKMLISQAYDVREFQIVNAPGWAETEHYDINAKAEGAGERITPDQLRPMLRALIEERFQLKTHNETKEMPLYALKVGKSGPKLTASTGEQGPMVRMGRGQLTAKKVPMSMLVQQLARQLGRKVIDQTELKGDFDFTLEWAPDLGQGGGGPFGGPPSPDALPSADSSGPSVFTALQEQLGLRLESQKGPVEILAIDKVEKPSEN